MKVVTVNVPESYIDAIEKIIGEDGLYPSRSELVRCAVREFILKELQMVKNMNKYKNPEPSTLELKEEESDLVQIGTNETVKTVLDYYLYICPECGNEAKFKNKDLHPHCKACAIELKRKVEYEFIKAVEKQVIVPPTEFKTYKILRRLEY